jgi:hypothetical protein
MVCLPYETWETVNRVKMFMSTTEPEKWTLSVFCPYPGCDIYRNPEKYGITWMERDFSKYWLYQEESMIATEVASREELTAHRADLYAWLLKYDEKRAKEQSL